MNENNEEEIKVVQFRELRKWIRVLTIVFLLLTIFPHFINNMVGDVVLAVMMLQGLDINDLAAFSIFVLEFYPYFSVLIVFSILSTFFVFKAKTTNPKSLMVSFGFVCICMILSYSSMVLMFYGVYLPWWQMGPVS